MISAESSFHTIPGPSKLMTGKSYGKATLDIFRAVCPANIYMQYQHLLEIQIF